MKTFFAFSTFVITYAFVLSPLQAQGTGEGQAIRSNAETPIREDKSQEKPKGEAQQESELDKALKAIEAEKRPVTPSDIGSLKVGGTTLRLIDLSLDSLVAVGVSNQENDELENLQGGGHDPRRRGFTIQNIEFSAMAAVDPYLTGEAHFIYFIDPIEGETVVELEEAFATTTSLPYGLQLEAGQFFTEFGRINPQHPHQWDFQDQPVINTRMFGPDGMRGAGFRLGWLLPVPFFSELHYGMQNANGETMASFSASDEFFEERPVGNRQFVDQNVHSLSDMVHLVRWNGSIDVTDEITAVLGASSLFGPNATGTHGSTRIHGLDFRVKWRPSLNERGWPFVVWQTEFMRRDYHADDQDFDPDEVPASGDEFTVGGESLKDYGFYTQLLYGFTKNWVAGLRFDWADGSGDSIDPATGVEATDTDAFRDERRRVSAMLAWHPTEFSRLRLQYNLDDAKHLDELKDADLLDDDIGHSVWLGVEFFFGAHAAHTY